MCVSLSSLWPSLAGRLSGRDSLCLELETQSSTERVKPLSRAYRCLGFGPAEKLPGGAGWGVVGRKKCCDHSSRPPRLD